MDSAMTLPPVSVSLLQLDSFKTVEDARKNITASFLEADWPNYEPTPSFPSLIFIDD